MPWLLRLKVCCLLPHLCTHNSVLKFPHRSWIVLILLWFFFAMFRRFGDHVDMLVASWARSFNKMTEMQKQPPLTQFWRFFSSLMGLLGGYLGSSWGFIAPSWLHLAPTWCHFDWHPKLSLDPWARFYMKIQKCKNKHPSHSFEGFLKLSHHLLSPFWAPLAPFFAQSWAPRRVLEPMLGSLGTSGRGF